MATPLYKVLKNRGTTFYSFPSASQDMNLEFQNDNYKISFNKFTLLNFPEQVSNTSDQEEGVLNFNKSSNGPLFYNFQPGSSGTPNSTFGEQLVESLRNYVANYDTTLRESRINTNTDFYNINETTTPTEMIFWKWCRKLNVLDLEPALHKIDWDKNLPDFDNNNGSDNNFFQKYLWKERDVNYYDASLQQGVITIDSNSKFKIGDYVILSGDTGSVISGDTSYKIDTLEISGSTTTITLDGVTDTDSSIYTVVIYLDYNKFIQYIGDVQATSKVQTSRNNHTEITAHIPHQAGQTPTILFEIEDNNNYYPGLEMPILPQEQQEEIVGAENLNSPIRTNPQDYAGTFYGYFDTEDKTYKCTNGDRLRYKGDYYGVLLNNNIGLDEEDNFEKLEEFNSDNIDGLKLDFNRDHYLKMNLPGSIIRNFDEFNSADFDGAPSDFEFNAILWYYDLDDGSGNITSNIYGIEFLNNPSDDDDDCDINGKLITPYKKLVSNGTQDGLSYIFNLNVNYNIDNDVLPLSYDPTTIYNQFGFDLYQNLMQTNARLQSDFVSIISGFTNINEDIFNIKSQMYSQTDIKSINEQIANLNELLQLYSTFQFEDSDTTLIETNFDGSYPTLKMNVINKKYDDITNVKISDVYTYNETNSDASYVINVPLTNQMRLNITNDNNFIENNAKILLNRDMSDKQNMEIFISPGMSVLSKTLDINIMYNNGSTTIETPLITGINLPTDLLVYNSLTPTASTYNNAYYTNNSLSLLGTKNSTYNSGTTTTTLELNDDVFEVDDYVYIDNFYFYSGSTTVDNSGVYQITSGVTESGVTTLSITLDTNGYTLRSNPKVSYYKGLKINILRVSSLSSSTLEDRYEITKTLL